MTPQDFQKAQRARILSCYGETAESLLEKSEENDLEKGGEGSRGGEVIGHTKSGKPIYNTKNNKEHKSYHKDFTEQDHLDAIKIHNAEEKQHSDKLRDSEEKGKSGEVHKKRMWFHGDNARRHRESVNEKRTGDRLDYSKWSNKDED